MEDESSTLNFLELLTDFINTIRNSISKNLLNFDLEFEKEVILKSGNLFFSASENLFDIFSEDKALLTNFREKECEEKLVSLILFSILPFFYL